MTALSSAQPGLGAIMPRHPDIARLVTLFDDRARANAPIGPVFEAVEETR